MTVSGFDPRRTIEEIAQERAEGVLNDAREDRVNNETPLAKRELRQEVYVLAHGGPGLAVTFLLDPADDEVLEGWFDYQEAAGKARIDLKLGDAMTLWEALQQEEN